MPIIQIIGGIWIYILAVIIAWAPRHEPQLMTIIIIISSSSIIIMTIIIVIIMYMIY